MKSSWNDLNACLAHLRCSEVLRRAIRTTNVTERAFEKPCRRTMVIPRFLDERSCLKLAYAELVRAVSVRTASEMSDIELRQLQHLRQELIAERKPRICSPEASRVIRAIVAGVGQ